MQIQLEERREEMKGNSKVTSDAEEMAGGGRSGPERRRRPRGAREEPAAFRVSEEEMKEKLVRVKG